MPVTEPNRPMSTAPKPAWMPSPKSLLIAGIAFLVGLLLFLMLWLDQRDNNRFYRSLEAPRSVAGQVFDPLPVPLPAGDNTASGMGEIEESPVGGAEPAIRARLPTAIRSRCVHRRRVTREKRSAVANRAPWCCASTSMPMAGRATSTWSKAAARAR